MNTYDLVVIGTGPSGGRIAKKAAKKGWKVAVVDENEYGGTCPNKGCDPKKVMTGIAEVYDYAKRLRGSGLQGEVFLDWSDLKAFTNTFTDPVSKMTEQSFQESGVDTFHGTAVFQDPHTIVVNDDVLSANEFVVATGAKPSPLPIEGGEHVTTSDQFFELENIPERVLFVGGGYISFEFAHLCARLGKKVTLLHRSRHVLNGFDHEMTNKLIEMTKDLGVDIHVDTEVKSIEKRDNGSYRLNVKKFDHEHHFHADLVVHGAGRAPNVDKLGLEKAEVETSKDGIIVNHNFQSSQAHIYAVGDVADTGQPPLTPVAGEEARRLLNHLLENKEEEAIDLPVPSVVFTYPKLGKVGLTQQEASEKKIPYEVQSKNITSFYSYKKTNESGAYVKVLTNPVTDELIGAHFLTGAADHLVNLFTVAIHKKMTKQELSALLFAYPSEESDIPSFF
ncbi:NAD(P)/FAD-dependent oxidoreductase [Halobacillus litoralis]|uniref:dihydrolipoyl dehydrogenase family protein n=1 Tax=Halobacillus litoralis TaxID=45668 RepID=UPI001CD55C61|nr:NAD(P)/FAD-dependent oxidoreductase [Halobacillus litoralis]MCA0969489.1 NAD(P)/FAD-dependent oxidoreductase [Halobacillus litoralis]